MVLFPYTANSKELPDDSVFEAVKKHDVGVFGIKPFADNSLFLGDSSLNPKTAVDSQRCRQLSNLFGFSTAAHLTQWVTNAAAANTCG